jgi:hypothetical protein
MTALLLDFAPPAWEAYQGQRATELGARLKQALERLTENPVGMCADPRSRRYQVIEDALRDGSEVWGMPVDAPDGGPWLVVWRGNARVVEIGYIGPAPGAEAVGG